MFEPLPIACHFGAYHTERITIIARARDPPDAAIGQHGHLERTGAWTVVRASGLGEGLREIRHAASFALGPPGDVHLFAARNIVGVVPLWHPLVWTSWSFSLISGTPGARDGGVAQLVRAAES